MVGRASLAPDTGVLAVIQYLGLVPQKYERTFAITVGEGIVYARSAAVRDDEKAKLQKVIAGAEGALASASVVVAMPRIEPVPFKARGAQLRILAEGSSAGELVARRRTQVVQSLEAIAIQDLEDRMGAIRGRAIARAVSKFVLAQLAEKTAAAATKKGWVGLLVGRATRAATNAAEEADTRSWFTLPAGFAMVRFDLPPGRYRVDAQILGAGEGILEDRTLASVEIRPGELTVVPLVTLY